MIRKSPPKRSHQPPNRDQYSRNQSKEAQEFCDLSNDEGAIAFTRPNILEILNTFADYLKATMPKNVGTNPNGPTIVTLSPSAILLNRLIDAIKDLDAGITHPVLKSVAKGGNKRNAESRKREVTLVQLVEAVHKEYFPSNRSAAELEIANRLRKRNVTIKGQPATQRLINSIVRHQDTSSPTANQDEKITRPRGRPRKVE